MIFMATHLATRRTFIAELARSKIRFSVMDAERGPDVLVNDRRTIPLEIRRGARWALTETTLPVDVSWESASYGLPIKLSTPIRCF